MKKTTIILMLFVTICSFAQTVNKEEFVQILKPVQEKVQRLENENKNLKVEIKDLNFKVKNINAKVLELNGKVETSNITLNQTATKLGLQISNTETNANSKIKAIDDNLSKKTLYGIIGVLLALILSGVLYLLLSKKQKADKTDVIEQLSKTKSTIEESLIKEFGKQTDLLDEELLLLKQQKHTEQTTTTAEPDHSLALKVASEINLIERNIKLMDAKTKGLKQLQASVGKLKDNLAANGYEMPELLGKQFHQGMKVIVASSIPDENLEKGSEIISKVLIPQVNYNDKMIQTAQIEVSVG